MRTFLFILLLMPLACTSAEPPPQVQVTVSSEAIAGQSQAPSVFRFGGGIWRVPAAFAWMEPQIWQANPQAGTYRLALAWEVIAPAKSLDDLKNRLKNYPLNAFAQDLVKRGGTLVISIDAMPQWLAANPSQKMMRDGPSWAKSPPRDYDTWSQVVRVIVNHFNNDLKLDPYYEIWNEPDWAWNGNTEQFLRLYQASAIGALSADAKAKVGGPAVSDWSAMGTANDKHADKTFLQQLFVYANQTPLPQFQRQRLPLDIVSWHAYGRDPSSYYRLAVPAIRQWLKDAGYPGNTALLIDEWNVFPEPPYPEGDLNNNHVGAALAGATLLSMWEAGLDHHAFQLLADPGTAGYTGGVFTTYAAPRGSWNSFQLASMLRGIPLTSKSSDPWVQTASFRDGDTLYVYITSFAPVDSMLLKAVSTPAIIEKPRMVAALRRFDQPTLVKFLTTDSAIDRGVTAEERDFLLSMRREFKILRDKRQAWSNGVDLSVGLPKMRFEAQATRYLVDASHSITPATLQRSRTALEGRIKGFAQDLDQSLRATSLPGFIARSFRQEVQEKMRMDQALSQANPAQTEVLNRLYAQAQSSYSKLLQAAIPESDRKPYQESVSIPASGEIRLHVEPYSVQLLVLKIAK